jgi:hypothetical protein
MQQRDWRIDSEEEAMTVYVDNARIPVTVGRVRGRWSHLTADRPEELHQFASLIGLRRAWFQARCRYGKCPERDGACRHFHYDVTESRRDQAIAHGAQAIDIRELGDIIRARADYFKGES